MRIKQIIPFPISGADLEARKNHIPTQYLSPDTVVDTVAVRNSFATTGPEIGISYYEWALLETYVVEAGVSAEDEGYDAVVVDSTTDSGVKTLRSRLTIPVVGPGMVAYAVALMLGRRFSIITYTDKHRFLSDDSLHSYGLTEKCASVRAIDRPPVLEGAPPEALEEESDLFVATGKAAIDDDGADALVLGSTVMHRAAAAMAARLPVPVVDPGPVGVAVAEMLVALGLSHSKHAYPSPPVIQDGLLHALPGVAATAG